MTFSKNKIILYSLLIILLIFTSYFFFDRRVALFFIHHQEQYKEIGKILSIFGQSQWYIGAGLLGFLYFKYIKKNALYKYRFLLLFYVNVFSGLLSIVLKTIFGRVRPWGIENGHDQYGFLLFQNFNLGFIDKFKYQIDHIAHHVALYASFPSGHTVTIFATVSYFYVLFPKYKYFWFILGTILASGRILANDHYISDVLAGMLVGTLSTLYIYQKMKNKVEKYS